MARDIFHQEVVAALEKEGWQVTHDPLTLKFEDVNVMIDLGAEQMIGAEKEGTRIAVEIKSFIGPSFIHQFHEAVGQYINYRYALELREPDRKLYLAVPSDVFERNMKNVLVRRPIETLPISLIVYHPDIQHIEQWIS